MPDQISNPPDDYFETPDGIIYGDPPGFWLTPDDWKLAYTCPNNKEE
jgi:hypothetical protein